MKFYFPLMLIFIYSVSSEAKFESMFDTHTSIPEPFKLRDPFQNPKFKSEKKEKREQRLSGVWNEERKLSQDVKLDSLDITGVLIGKNRRVLIKVGDVVYKFKEEDNIGPNGPKIKAILPGGIILVEQITNIYGEAEYIETAIPLSK